MHTGSSSTHSRDALAFSDRLRTVAIGATLAVQDQLKAAFRSDMEASFKRDRRDIVTIHDKQSEEKISEFILGQEPDSEIVGEEGGSQGSGSIKWFVDPIDGTANFACGLPSWCVSVGAVLAGEIVAGAILDPMGGNLFSADLESAFLGEATLRSRAQPNQEHANLIASYPSARDFVRDGRDVSLDRFGRLVETFAAVRRNGSAALGLAHVAAGWSDAAMGFGVNPWDVTAAILIVEKSGGTYTGLNWADDGSASAVYEAPGYVAMGSGARYALLSAIGSEIASDRRRESRKTTTGSS